MFNRRQIVALLIPLMLEQVLTGMMGIVDTMMVTSAGETAISAVALVNSINSVVLEMLVALAAGGVIVCSQYLGRGEVGRANDVARQVLLVSLTLAAAITVICLLLRRPMLALIFGEVEQLVLAQASDYFFITALSYPFLAAQQTASAVFRADGHAAPPMAVTALANVVNIIGNSILIFVFDWGVIGAAVSTLFSRVVSAVVLMMLLRNPELKVSIRNYFKIRPSQRDIGMVLRVGVPSGFENSMFQLGKVVVQSTVSTLGTTVMAAQAMITTLDLVACMPSLAIGTGLLTVAGQCMGAGRVDEAKKYSMRFCVLAEIVVIAMSVLIVGLTPFITKMSSMSPESAGLTFRMMALLSVVKCIIWVWGFVLPSGMRAAGDVRFSAIMSAVSMWVFRAGGGILLCRVFNMGFIGIWLAWFSDWAFRTVIYIWRFRSGKWQSKRVIKER